MHPKFFIGWITITSKWGSSDQYWNLWWWFWGSLIGRTPSFLLLLLSLSTRNSGIYSPVRRKTCKSRDWKWAARARGACSSLKNIGFWAGKKWSPSKVGIRHGTIRMMIVHEFTFHKMWSLHAFTIQNDPKWRFCQQMIWVSPSQHSDGAPKTSEFHHVCWLIASVKAMGYRWDQRVGGRTSILWCEEQGIKVNWPIQENPPYSKRFTN